jgi:uncharacterized protein YqeY
MREQLKKATVVALKAQDKARVGALRLISAALQEREIAVRKDKLSDAESAEVLQKMIKQRRDALALYEQAGRKELAQQEAAEIAVIEEFLPKQMGEAEVNAVISAVIEELGAAGPKDMGRVMGALKQRYAGQMDFGKASGLVKGLLN